MKIRLQKNRHTLTYNNVSTTSSLLCGNACIAGDNTYVPETEEEKIPPYALHKRWVPVTVCRKKSEAVDYCRDRFGRNCFKDNDKVKVAFT